VRNRLPWAVTALAVLVWVGPLQWHWYAHTLITDLPVYENAARQMADGGIPYHDFSLEYPPLAALLFLVARLLPFTYSFAFSGLMLIALCATALGVMATARALGLDARREALAGGAVAVSPLLLGDFITTRFDLAVAALLAWTLWAAVVWRFRLAWGLLAAAILLKLVPIVLVPVLVIHQRRAEGSRRAWAEAAAGVGAAAVVIAVFAAIAPDGTWDMLSYNLRRPLQIESSGAAYMLGLHWLAGIPLHVVDSYGSQNLAGPGTGTIAAISTALTIVLVVAIAATFAVLLRRARPPADARLFVAATAATMAALLATGKVLSPQFLVWLLPAGLLVSGPYGAATAWTTLLAMALTQAYFPSRYFDLVNLDAPAIGLLVLRDSVLVALVALAWPRPAVATPPERTLPQRTTPAPEEAAVSAVSGRLLSG